MGLSEYRTHRYPKARLVLKGGFDDVLDRPEQVIEAIEQALIKAGVSADEAAEVRKEAERALEGLGAGGLLRMVYALMPLRTFEED